MEWERLVGGTVCTVCASMVPDGAVTCPGCGFVVERSPVVSWVKHVTCRQCGQQHRVGIACPVCGSWPEPAPLPSARPAGRRLQAPPPPLRRLRGIGVVFRVCVVAGLALTFVSFGAMIALGASGLAGFSVLLPLGVVGGIGTVTLIAGHFVFRGWTFRAMGNAKNWHREPHRFTPGWAWWPLLIGFGAAIVTGTILSYVQLAAPEFVFPDGTILGRMSAGYIVLALVLGLIWVAIPITLDKMVLNDVWRLSDPASAAGTFRGRPVHWMLNVWYIAGFVGVHLSAGFEIGFGTADTLVRGAMVWVAPGLAIVASVVSLVTLVPFTLQVERRQDEIVCAPAAVPVDLPLEARV